MIHDKKIKDMTGKFLELGHIVAVRYVWNSYVGIVRMSGLCSEGAKRLFLFTTSTRTTYLSGNRTCG